MKRLADIATITLVLAFFALLILFVPLEILAVWFTLSVGLGLLWGGLCEAAYYWRRRRHVRQQRVIRMEREAQERWRRAA